MVFIIKYRGNVCTDPMVKRCERIMRDVCEKSVFQLSECNGADDHFHLLVHYPPKIALVNSLKRVSTHYLRQEYCDHARTYPGDGHP